MLYEKRSMEKEASCIDAVKGCHHAGRGQPARQVLGPARTYGKGIEVQTDDMAGAILDAALAEVLMDREELFAMETVFSSGAQEICGTLLVLPTAEFMDVMISHKEQFSRVQW